MVRREPSLLALVERAAAMPAGSSVDAATLRREVGRALRHENPDDIEADLVLLNRATEEEWLVLEERVRELVPESRGWKRERLVEILVSWREKHGRHQEARRILREMGTTKQRLFLLVREGKPDEAAALAREHFTEMPGVIIELARALAEAGAAEHGVALLTELAKSEDSHPGYVEWLAEYHRKSGDPEKALTWQRQVFLGSPTVKSL